MDHIQTRAYEYWVACNLISMNVFPSQRPHTLDAYAHQIEDAFDMHLREIYVIQAARLKYYLSIRTQFNPLSEDKQKMQLANYFDFIKKR